MELNLIKVITQFITQHWYNVVMKKRPYRKSEFPPSIWDTAQDSYLIENSTLTDEVLQQQLPFSLDEINERKEVLGLIRRRRQLRKLFE